MVLTPSSMVPLGTPAAPFRLPDTTSHSGAFVALDDFVGKPLLVVFMCNHCPYVVHIADKLSEVTATLMDRGVAVVGISSNDVSTHPQDGPAEMTNEAGDRGYRFPYLYDETQEVARAFDAQCTPDFFLYDQEHRLAYRGQFDAARPGNDVPVTGETLLAAVDAMLGEGDMPEQIPSMGCNIKWRAA